MKALLTVLFGVYVALLAHPAWSVILTPTDGDVDSVIIGGSLEEDQIVAFTLPDTAPDDEHGYIPIDVEDLYDHDEILHIDIILSILGQDTFSVYLFDGLDWHEPTESVVLGDDHVVLNWDLHPGGEFEAQMTLLQADVRVVPIPAAVWLFGSGLMGLVGWSRMT